jgi:hypothetical protein
MPNVNNPHGLRPLMRNLLGGPVEVQEYNKLAGVSTAIFRNDVVSVVTGGNIQPGRSTAIVGVSLDYGKASTATTHKVVIAPFSMYEAQDDDAVTGLLAADMGKNANVTVATGGNTSTLISGHQISKSSVATTNTLDLQLHRLLQDPSNDFGPNARVEVSFNTSHFAFGRIGV